MDTAIHTNNLRSFLGSTLRSAHRLALNLMDKPALMLLYHRVANLENDRRMLAVKPENFIRHVEHLKKKYYIIDIDEFVYLKKCRKKFPKNSVVVTFDDGYYDNYTNVLPVLDSYGIQALFFISTLWIDTRKEYWWDEIERILLTDQDLPEQLDLELDNRRLTFDTSSAIARTRTYGEIRRMLRRSRFSRQEKILTSLVAWAGLDMQGRATHQSLNKKEIKKMSASKSAVIGAHAHTHTQLSLYSPEEQYQEIKQSKDILESITGRPVNYFSYPFGSRSDYNLRTIRICKDLGFDICCSNFYFQIHKWTDRFQVPRILIRDCDLDTFKSFMRFCSKY